MGSPGRVIRHPHIDQNNDTSQYTYDIGYSSRYCCMYIWCVLISTTPGRPLTGMCSDQIIAEHIAILSPASIQCMTIDEVACKV